MGAVDNAHPTTQDGGAFGYGAVFKLDTSGNETVLHSFTNSSGDGANPYAGLIMDRAGNLYGTTFYGGANNYGTVFKLDTFGNETVLHSFTNSSGDGAYPYAGLIMDRAGNLYGTTSQGGVNYGTVFKLDTSGNETVLHSFNYADGNLPAAGLIMDRAGNLYGTTFYGGAFSYGTVFKLDTSGNETVLHSFAFSGGDGAYPYAPLIMDRAGNLYGTTFEGGADVYGTVFKLDTSGNETVLHSFPSLGGDGATPFFGALITDKAGNLYGTTEGGGASGYGTVFKLVP